MPVYKSVLVTDVDRKHLNWREWFQQHTDANFNQFFPECESDEGSSRLSDTNIRWTYTILWHRQNWVIQFKRGDFYTSAAPRPGRHKTLTTSEIIEQIYELNLEDCRISRNQ